MKQGFIYYIPILWLFLLSPVFAQKKKALDYTTYNHWNQIRNKKIANNGKWVIYSLTPQKGDATLKIHSLRGQEKLPLSFERGTHAEITQDSKFVVFKIEPPLESTKDARRKKIARKNFPKDSLGIYALEKDTLIKVAKVKSFQVPKKGAGWLAYHMEVVPPIKPVIKDTSQSEKENKKILEKEEESAEKKEDTVLPKTPEEVALENAQQQILLLQQEIERYHKERRAAKKKKNKKPRKKENKENGTKLILRNLLTARQDTFPFVTSYSFDQKGTKLAFISTGDDSTFAAGVYVYNLKEKKLSSALDKPGKHKHLTWDDNGQQLAFIADTDTSQANKKAQVHDFHLYHWQEKQKSASVLAKQGSNGIPANWYINPYERLKFSKDGSKLYFGTMPPPLLKDTTLLEEEIVRVDIWNWQDKKLQSEQNHDLQKDRKKSYTAVVYPRYKRITQLGSPEIPHVKLTKSGNADFALGLSSIPYDRKSSWEGGHVYDMYLVSFRDGKKRKIQENTRTFHSDISPNGQHITWYDIKDSTWYNYSLRTGQKYNLTQSVSTEFYRYALDGPKRSIPYGKAGWTENNQYLLIYDQFDIWKFHPEKKEAPQRLTPNGRENKIEYRCIRLDNEKDFIAFGTPSLLYAFDQETKASGYFTATLSKTEIPRKLIFDDFSFSRYLIKAKDSNFFLFTRQSFTDFPDLYYADANFTKINKISEANPQQANYWWGSVELVKWTAPNGEELNGLLYKPENFDPGKKYPMISYFYEKKSNDLHRYSMPKPSRSTVHASEYTSNSYLVFIPDITYRIGYPGQSAYEAVVSGVTHLLNQGFVDKDKLGIQGQSWGGYQVAYIITRTNLFSAAMAGAPVSNMTSAYGGIRWASGKSRMFQYEDGQSRIGATLWDRPWLYIENSPLFHADKVETPLLMMHNDHDGAVPWYQGIEYFTALRRLNKPVWMLTYNGEQHNLTKWQNRVDLSIRMRQFFDYYLKFAPPPVWMKYGVPALEKGIKKRYELVNESTNH